jgi:hypothetical protein
MAQQGLSHVTQENRGLLAKQQRQAKGLTNLFFKM